MRSVRRRDESEGRARRRSRRSRSGDLKRGWHYSVRRPDELKGDHHTHEREPTGGCINDCGHQTGQGFVTKV